MEIITRANWGALAARSIEKTTWARRREFIVHHTAGPTTQTPSQIQRFHQRDRGWADVGYNFLVRDDGTIYEGRGWLVVGAHAPGHNTSGIGVAFIGNNNPTDAAKRSIRWLYDEACRLAGRRLAARTHSQVTSTDCPGPKLRSWVGDGMPLPGGGSGPKGQTPPFPGRLLTYPPMTTGADAYAWQAQMRDRGWDLIPDGSYGPRSRDICVAFQRDSTAHGWPLDDDGVVGPATWRASFERPTS